MHESCHWPPKSNLKPVSRTIHNYLSFNILRPGSLNCRNFGRLLELGRCLLPIRFPRTRQPPDLKVAGYLSSD